MLNLIIFITLIALLVLCIWLFERSKRLWQKILTLAGVVLVMLMLVFFCTAYAIASTYNSLGGFPLDV